MTTTTADGSTVRLGNTETPLSQHARPSLIGRVLCFFGRHKDREAARFAAKDLPATIGYECAHCNRRALHLPLIAGPMNKAAERRAKRQTEHATAWRDRNPEHQPKPRGRKPRAQQQQQQQPAETPPLLKLSSDDPAAEAAHE